VFSLDYCNGNLSETLLALTFATLPYREMPISLPVIDYSFKVPLPSSTKEIYDKKLIHIPKNLFFEKSNRSDIDKLAHFFGNAFLSYNATSFNLSEFMSIFVEVFELSFKVEGAIDYRDLLINSLGDNFGNSLNSDKKSLPSTSLKLYYLFHLLPGN
jgi:hypothetical protein